MGVTCTRVVKFVRKPIDGKPSVSYWIVPSVTQIHRKENGVCDPTSVSAVKMRQVGDGVASVTSEKVLKYRHIRTDNLNPTPQTYTTAIVCSSKTVRIEFLLYNATNDTVPISTETVTVLDDGANGDSISGITNYYYVGTSATTYPPVGSALWETNPPTMTATNRYLWNYEVIRISDAFGNLVSNKTTTPRLIGVCGQTGVGIASITEHYLASSAASGVTKDTSGWTETIQTISSSKCYLWNYETINYTNGTPFDTEPVVIGVYSQGGTGPRGYRGSKHRQFVWAECDDEQEFMSGQDDDEFFDTVIYGDYIYLCIASHTKISTPPPQDAAHWAFAEKWRIVATDVMLAERAVIKFQEGNQLLIYDEEERLKGGMVSIRGNYPLFFIHPRVTPIAVSFLFYATSADTAPSASLMNSTFPNINATYKYLWARLCVSYSDGSTTFGDIRKVFTYSSTIPTTYKIQYQTKSVQSSCTDADPWQNGLEEPSEDNKYLYVRLCIMRDTSQLGTYIMYAGQYSDSTDSTSSIVQIMRDGTAIFGERNGAMIRLNPQFDASRGLLPRMEITDTEGSISATFDGSKVITTDELYGGGTSTSTATTNKTTGNVTIGQGHGTSPTSVSNSVVLCTISCGSAGTLSLSELSVRLEGGAGQFTGGSNIPVSMQSGLAELVVGGRTVAQRNMYFNQETLSTFKFPSSNINVGAGVYQIVLRATVWGFTNAWAKATTTSGFSATFNCDKYISRYFANGLCLGSAANNHFSVLNLAGKIAYEMLTAGGTFNINNGSVGISGNGSNMQMMKSGTWFGNQPLVIFAGYVVGTNTTASFNKVSSFDGNLPTVSRNSTGKYTISFPSAWSSKITINSSNTYALVTGYGTIYNGSNPNKAQVESLWSSGMSVTMSDDDTLNDGSFFVELKLY